MPMNISPKEDLEMYKVMLRHLEESLGNEIGKRYDNLLMERFHNNKPRMWSRECVDKYTARLANTYHRHAPKVNDNPTESWYGEDDFKKEYRDLYYHRKQTKIGNYVFFMNMRRQMDVVRLHRSKKQTARNTSEERLP